MPFHPNPNFRPYQAGDFIFGLDAAVDNFRHAQGQAAAGTVMVRQLSHKQAAVNKFKDPIKKPLNLDYIDETLDHPKYHTIINSAPQGDIANNQLFRRKSKAGLNFCVASGRFVHFVMGGLNLREVSEKSYDGTQGGRPEFKLDANDKYRTVTGAELRWIYRHKDHTDVQERIQFWLNNAQVCPPWDPQGPGYGTPDGWQAYNPSHTYAANLKTPD